MKIAIDPGHGMSNATPGVFDPGAVASAAGETFREADIALRYALGLKDELRARGVEVFMTRDDHDDRAPVVERAGSAERAGCDAFVSLHLNSFDSASANGVEVLYRDDADDDLALVVRDAVVAATGLAARSNKQRSNLAVLRFDGPAVLIELGFISNARDRTTLLDTATRADVVRHVADVLVARLGAGAAVAARPARLRVSAARLAAAAYVLPAYARTTLGATSGIPWSSATRIPELNFYSGLVRDSLHRFPATAGLVAGAMFYEAKFAIDGDGSSGNQGDDTFQPNTSLHDAAGRPLNSREFPFIVLPLRHNLAGRPQWSDFGVELGDLGVCFFRNGTSCAVLFGDKGPATKLGEGSMLAAEELGINSDPNFGGIDHTEIPPGILHFVFPGSRDVRLVANGRPRTSDTPQSLTARAWALFSALGGPTSEVQLARPAITMAVRDRLPATPRRTGALSANLVETLEHTGQAKVIVKLDMAMAAGGAVAEMAAVAAGARSATLPADLEALFVATNAEDAGALAAASIVPTRGKRGRTLEGAPASAMMPRVHVYPRLGLAVGTVAGAGAEALARHPRVREVVKAPEISLIRPVGGRAAAAADRIAWGLPRMRVNELWSRGFEGQGVLVGHLDTGIDGRHPALKPALAAFAAFDLSARQVPGARPTDSGTHGTHTAGTIAGRLVGGVRVGVAPQAKLLSAMVIEGGQVIERILAGMEWVVESNGRILSLSLGLRGFTTAFEVVIQSLRDAGVLPVVAAGNEFANSSRSPGNYPNVLSVGACDEAELVADFSSSQTFARPADPIVPDIVAPGVDVLSCSVGGGYRLDSGTSMATPAVAGLAALLLSAKPSATVAELEEAILRSCTRPGSMPRHRANRGVPDALVALEHLLGQAVDGIASPTANGTGRRRHAADGDARGGGRRPVAAARAAR